MKKLVFLVEGPVGSIWKDSYNCCYITFVDGIERRYPTLAHAWVGMKRQSGVA